MRYQKRFYLPPSTTPSHLVPTLSPHTELLLLPSSLASTLPPTSPNPTEFQLDREKRAWVEQEVAENGEESHEARRGAMHLHCVGYCACGHTAQPGGVAEAGRAAEVSQGGSRGGKRHQEHRFEDYGERDMHPDACSKQSKIDSQRPSALPRVSRASQLCSRTILSVRFCSLFVAAAEKDRQAKPSGTAGMLGGQFNWDASADFSASCVQHDQVHAHGSDPPAPALHCTPPALQFPHRHSSLPWLS
ncbi:unnamed protein product, partial [Closterium sp. Naga37s-1]